jgi:hypothetical protein
MRELGLSEEEIARRKAFLDFGDEDIERLHGCTNGPGGMSTA